MISLLYLTVYSLSRIYSFVLLARAIMSFLPNYSYGSLYELIYRITEPYISFIRRLMGRYAYLGMFDVSFIVGYFIISLVPRIFLLLISIF